MARLIRYAVIIAFWLAALVSVVLLCAAPGFSQNVASPLPFSKQQFFSNAGAPLASGKLCTFAAGTTTPLTSYTTTAGSGGASNTNPVVLDSSGRADVFLTNGVGYKWILYAAGGNSSCPNSGTVIWSEDNYIPQGAVTVGSGTANRVAKYSSASVIGNGSIQDLYSGESMRIQTDGTLSVGTSTDSASGLYVYTATANTGKFESTAGTPTITMLTTSGQVALLSASLAGGLDFGTSAAYLNLSYDGATLKPTTTAAMALGTASNRFLTGNIAGLTAITLSMSSGTSAGLTLSGAAPTISSGFGTSPSVTGTAAAMRVNVGTGGVATAGVIGMPTAATGWNCQVANLTALDANIGNTRTVQISSTTTTVSIEHQTISTGAALAWTASDIVAVSCLAY